MSSYVIQQQISPREEVADLIAQTDLRRKRAAALERRKARQERGKDRDREP